MVIYSPIKYFIKAVDERMVQAILNKIIEGRVFLVEDHIKAIDEIKANM